MTNILVPTDFTPASLKLAEQAVKVLNREVNIVLFHAFEMPFYYADFFRAERQPWHDLLNDNLRLACRQLKERYPWLINSIHLKFMQGDTSALFRNWADANDIDMIVYPNNYVYTKIHARSVNPLPFFKKSRLTLLQDLQVKEQVIQKIQPKKQHGYPAIPA